MWLMIAAIFGQVWWWFAKNGEVLDYNELNPIGKLCYKIFVFAMNKYTGTKGEEALALYLQTMIDMKGRV